MASVSSGYVKVALSEVDMSFIEDIPVDLIVKNYNNDELLGSMDADEIFEWVEKKFDVTIKNNE